MIKRIIIICLILLFISNTVFAQTPEFSLKTKYNPTFKLEYAFTKYSSRERALKRKTDWTFTVLSASYLTLSVLDLYTTYEAIELGAKEANPFMAAIIDNKPLAITVKMGVSALTIYLLYQLKKNHKISAYVLLGVVTLVQGYVVYHNFQVIKRLRN